MAIDQVQDCANTSCTYLIEFLDTTELTRTCFCSHGCMFPASTRLCLFILLKLLKLAWCMQLSMRRWGYHICFGESEKKPNTCDKHAMYISYVNISANRQGLPVIPEDFVPLRLRVRAFFQRWPGALKARLVGYLRIRCMSKHTKLSMIPVCCIVHCRIEWHVKRWLMRLGWGSLDALCALICVVIIMVKSGSGSGSILIWHRTWPQILNTEMRWRPSPWNSHVSILLPSLLLQWWVNFQWYTTSCPYLN